MWLAGYGFAGGGDRGLRSSITVKKREKRLTFSPSQQMCECLAFYITSFLLSKWSDDIDR